MPGARGRRLALLAAATLIVICALVTQRLGAGVVGSGSMAPALLPGDVVVYDRTESARPGEVLVFDRSGIAGRVVHRVVDRDERGSYLTRGDANPVPDRDRVEPGAALGKAVVVLPFGRLVALVRRGR